MEDLVEGTREKSKKIVTKGKRELRNLEWDMNDGMDHVCWTDEVGKGKMCGYSMKIMTWNV